MKFSVSVPDDLWLSVHGEDPTGRSETVQKGLQLLAAEQRARQRPLANAPDQSALDRYAAAFEEAVGATVDSVAQVLDNGYRLGLLIAPAMTVSDFDALDVRGSATDVRKIFQTWEGPNVYVLSWSFANGIHEMLQRAYKADGDKQLRSRLAELLGNEGDPTDESRSGVHWDQLGDEGPLLSDTYIVGVLSALRDVRDEALRRLRPEPEEP